MQHQVDILFVINDLKFLKSHRINLIKFLVSKGLKVSVATNLEGAKLDEVEKIQKNIGLVNFKFSRSSLNLFTNILALTNLFKIIRKTNPSKILLVSSKPIIYGGLATIFNFKREVCCLISGMGYAFISSSLRSRIVKNIILILYRLIFLKRLTKVIFQNKEDLNLFVRKRIVNRKKSILIRGNGISIKKFKRTSYPSKLVFLFASRLLVDKGINEFIEVASKFSSSEVVFRVAGNIDPDNPNSLNKEQLITLKKNHFVDYVGEIEYEDMPSLFSSSHIFVLPSYREGLPQVALEAAASSMPLIITDTVGCRDCLEDKKSGFLIPIKDTVSLEEKIDFFIKNPEKVKTMGDRSKKFVENNFSEEIIFNQFLSLLKGT